MITAEALAEAGVTPEELVSAVHPSLIGNAQGTGMGGMSSICKVFMAPTTGRASTPTTSCRRRWATWSPPTSTRA